MKTVPTFVFFLVVAVATGCTDKAKEAEKAKQDAAAKARADAAKKEMQALPTVFSTPDYFKKNPQAKSADSTPTKTETTKK
jgi:hypothetical protein